MQNQEKSNEVKRLCTEILMQVDSLEDTKTGSYFDYDGTLEMLEQAKQLVEDTQRYPRPANLPSHFIWDERPWDGEDNDPYVFSGTMSGGEYDFDDDMER